MNSDTKIPQPVARQKLTDWANEPSLSDLKSDHQMAVSQTNNITEKVRQWANNLNPSPHGKSDKDKSTSKRSRIQPKIIRRQAEWRYPGLSEPFLTNNRLFEVSPVTWEDQVAAEQNALVLNYQFETKINKVQFIDSLVRHLVDEGSAIVQVGWKREIRRVTEMQTIYEYADTPDFAEQLQQLLQLEQENPNEFSQLAPAIKESVLASKTNNRPVLATPLRKERVKVEKVISNTPTVHVCELSRVFLDPTCNGKIEEASFVIYAYETSLSDLRKSGRNFKNLDAVNAITATNPLSLADQDFNSSASAVNFQDKPRQKITAYEYWGYWDIDNSGITTPIVATWIGDTLIELRENPMPNGDLPFVVIPYLPVKNSFYGEPDGELLEDHQKVIGAVLRGMVDLLAKSANSQIGVAKNMLDSTNKIKFERGDNYEYNPNFHPQNSVYQHKFPELPNSGMAIMQLFNNEAEALTGIKSFGNTGMSGAALGGSSITSPAVRGVLDAATKREMSILRRLTAGIVEIGKKIIAMNSMYLDDTEIIRVTNDNLVKINREELAGQFDLTISISTPEIDQARASDLSFMLQTLGQSMGMEYVQLITSKIAKLRQMPDLEHAIKNFKPTPDPLSERERMAEIALKEAQAKHYEAQALESRSKAQVNATKVPVEQARAENLQANADATRLKADKDYSGKTAAEHAEQLRMKHDSDVKKRLLDAELKADASNMQHEQTLLQKAADAELQSSLFNGSEFM